MTRREFDAATKQNWGGPYMASDEREGYRDARCLPALVRGQRPGSGDPLARRWAYLQRRGKSPLWIGSPMRAPALYRAGLRHCIGAKYPITA